MSAIAGKSVVVKVSATAMGTYTQTCTLNDVTFTIEGDNLDVTTFCNTYMNRIQGLKDTSFNMGGFYDPTDTNGQVVILNALLNSQGVIFIQFLPDGTNGWQLALLVSSFEISATADGFVEVSIDFEGTGAITAVP